MVAAASTEIMQLFHALVPVIGCTFAAEVHPVHSVRLPFALPRETVPSCMGQFLTVAKLMATSHENYVSVDQSTPAADEET